MFVHLRNPTKLFGQKKRDFAAIRGVVESAATLKRQFGARGPEGVWRTMCWMLSIWDFGDPLDTFRSPKSLVHHGTSFLRN